MTYTDISSIIPKNRKAYVPPSFNNSNQLESSTVLEAPNKNNHRETRKTSTKGIIAPPQLHLSNTVNISGSNMFRSPLDGLNPRKPIYPNRPSSSSSSSRSSTKIIPSKSKVALYVLDSTTSAATAPYIPPLPKAAQYNVVSISSNQVSNNDDTPKSSPIPDLSTLSMPVFNHQENSSKTQNRMRISKKPLYEIHNTSPKKSTNKLSSPSQRQNSFDDKDFGSSDFEFESSLELEHHQKKAPPKSTKSKTLKVFPKKKDQNQKNLSPNSSPLCEDDLIDLNVGEVSYSKSAENDFKKGPKVAVNRKKSFPGVSPIQNTEKNQDSSKSESPSAASYLLNNPETKSTHRKCSTPLLTKSHSPTHAKIAENKDDTDIFNFAFPSRSNRKLLSLSSRSMTSLPKSNKSVIQPSAFGQHNKLGSLREASSNENQNKSNNDFLEFDKRITNTKTTLEDKLEHSGILKKISTTLRDDLKSAKYCDSSGVPAKNKDSASPFEFDSDDDIEVLDQCEADAVTKSNLKRHTNFSVAEISKRTKVNKNLVTRDSPTIEDSFNHLKEKNELLNMDKVQKEKSLEITSSLPKQKTHKSLSSFAFTNLDKKYCAPIPGNSVKDSVLNTSDATIPDNMNGLKKKQVDSTLKTNVDKTLEDTHNDIDQFPGSSSQNNIRQYPSSFGEAFGFNDDIDMNQHHEPNEYLSSGSEENYLPKQPAKSFLPPKSPEFEFDDEPSLDLDLENLSELGARFDFVRKSDVISERKISTENEVDFIPASSELIEIDSFSASKTPQPKFNGRVDNTSSVPLAGQNNSDSDELPDSEKDDFKIPASFEMPPPSNIKPKPPVSHSTIVDTSEIAQRTESLLDLSFELSQAIDKVEMSLSQQNPDFAEETSAKDVALGGNIGGAIGANHTTANTLPTFFNITNALVFPSNNKMPAYKNPLKQNDKKGNGRNYKTSTNDGFSLASKNKQPPVIITEFGPWTPETLELFDWRPPNLSYPPNNL